MRLGSTRQVVDETPLGADVCRSPSQYALVSRTCGDQGVCGALVSEVCPVVSIVSHVPVETKVFLGASGAPGV